MNSIKLNEYGNDENNVEHEPKKIKINKKEKKK